MAINKRKSVLALIPFFATTIGVAIFIIFFNYGELTFTAESPFSVTTGKETVNDTNGVVHLRLAAGEQTIVAKKAGYFDQTFQETVAVNAQKEIAVDFSFIPVSASIKFIPPISYSSSQQINDNQVMDLLFTAPITQAVTPPSGYTRAVWAQNGTSACFFNPTNPLLEPKLWQKNKNLQSLPTNTFNCFSAPQTIISAQLNNQNLLINSKLVKRNVQLNTILNIDPSGTWGLLAETYPNSSNTLVSVFNLNTNQLIEIGTFTLIEPARFISIDRFALRTSTGTAIYVLSAPQTAILLSFNVPLTQLAYSTSTQSYYYLTPTPASGLPSFSELLENNSVRTLSLVSNKSGKEMLLQTFKPEQNFSGLSISQDGKKLFAVNKDTLELQSYQLQP